MIAPEAGAAVTRLDGSPELLDPPCQLVAANPALHAQMLDVIKSIPG